MREQPNFQISEGYLSLIARNRQSELGKSEQQVLRDDSHRILHSHFYFFYVENHFNMWLALSDECSPIFKKDVKKQLKKSLAHVPSNS